jgi:hypothetical protein
MRRGRTSEIVFVCVEQVLWHVRQFGRIDNSHYLHTCVSIRIVQKVCLDGGGDEKRTHHTVYSYDFAEDDTVATQVKNCGISTSKDTRRT